MGYLKNQRKLVEICDGNTLLYDPKIKDIEDEEEYSDLQELRDREEE